MDGGGVLLPECCCLRTLISGFYSTWLFCFAVELWKIGHLKDDPSNPESLQVSSKAAGFPVLAFRAFSLQQLDEGR